MMIGRVLLLAIVAAGPAFAGGVPSRFGIDAPELARLGKFAVGVKTLTLVQTAQPDVLAFDAASGTAPERDRVLSVDLWYPARAVPAAPPAVYEASFPSEAPAPPASFSVPGLAIRGAPPAGGGYPLVIVSHGYSGTPAAMTWLTENLASKGYVVAAIRHQDPPITERSAFPQPLLRRALDIAFVARTLQDTLAREHLIDPTRTALIGYSAGGYGVLTAAGATLDPASPAAHMVPGGLLLPFARGGALRESVLVKGLRAAVALAPMGGGPLAAWGTQGIGTIQVPLLLIAGNRDRTLDYNSGARAFFDQATGTHRYLLTFEGAGHSIGYSPAPDSMRRRLWDQDWFDGPVWRTERVNAINTHFITAFLDLYVKGDASRAAYLTVADRDSSAGIWPATNALAYDAYSPGTPEITVWKGFQRSQSAGLELLQADPSAAK
jgi:predicted dienelactone hydrolase